MSKEALQVFDGCPSREIKSVNRLGLSLTCPKYPKGTTFVHSSDPYNSLALFKQETTRGEAALLVGCLGCKFGNPDIKLRIEQEMIERLHPIISENCGPLFLSEYYPEAAMTGFKIVRDRLRELTGHERASEAFGKGGLYINGGTPDHVDDNFQAGARSLMVTIDMFRNEGSHTAYGNITASERALEYLGLSSLSMHLLDSAQVKDR